MHQYPALAGYLLYPRCRVIRREIFALVGLPTNELAAGNTKGAA
jgi:hypothetical protein